MFNNYELKKATRTAHEALLRAISDSNEPKHTFSVKFNQKIKLITTIENNQQPK